MFKLSVSKTSTFVSCKAKYKFTYILKLPRKEFEYHTFGRFAHRVLELFHLHIINGVQSKKNELMGRSFNEAMAEFDGKISQAQKDEAYKIVKEYLATLKAGMPNVLEVEKVFNLELKEDFILTGMIDRVQLDPDGIYHIADYKTSKSDKYLKNDLLQLLTYAYVIYMEHPELKKVRVSYIMLRLGCKVITKEFGLEEILAVKKRYEDHYEAIQNETEFAPNPQVLCNYCEFNTLCVGGSAIIAERYKTGKTDFTAGKMGW